MIKVENVIYKYNGVGEEKSSPALNGVNLTINDGEYICIIGSNGSGKSTLAKLLNGILIPTEGTVGVDDMNVIDEEQILNIRRRVGIVFQNPDNQIISSVVYEDVAFGPQNIGMEKEKIEEAVDRSLGMVGLSEYKNHFTKDLSGGQKQKLAIAGVLAMNPKYIIFDEATSMLDKKASSGIVEIIKSLNKENNIAIIHITQIPEEAVLADRVIVMDKGKIVLDGTPEEVFRDSSFLKECNLAVPLSKQLLQELREEGIDISESGLTYGECVNILEGLLK